MPGRPFEIRKELDGFGHAESHRVYLAAVPVLRYVIVCGRCRHGPHCRRRYRLLEVSRAVGQVTCSVNALDAGATKLVHYYLVQVVKVATQLLGKLDPGVGADLYEYPVKLELIGALVRPVQPDAIQAVWRYRTSSRA